MDDESVDNKETIKVPVFIGESRKRSHPEDFISEVEVSNKKVTT